MSTTVPCTLYSTQQVWLVIATTREHPLGLSLGYDIWRHWQSVRSSVPNFSHRLTASRWSTNARARLPSEIRNNPHHILQSADPKTFCRSIQWWWIVFLLFPSNMHWTSNDNFFELCTDLSRRKRRIPQKTKQVLVLLTKGSYETCSILCIYRWQSSNATI